ncbi:slightly ste11-like protein [Emydomyces testavorans]|uniref:Slightly ste11-like protein n=1 Tax=Emydomyces testavorans TaxID=2070801 RepID=A0AAF0DM92_9EURO|nr:slightly ste11-like protein [Emydomyces testavorans]
MSYDRVLPKPLGLHYDISGRDLSICPSTLLDHRITADRLNLEVFEKHRHLSSAQLRANVLATEATQSPILDPGMGSKVRVTEAARVLEPPMTRKRVSPIVPSGRSREERAASAGSSKSTSSRDSSVQFCLCQPDPKIPRPRNGSWARIFSLKELRDYERFILSWACPLAFILFRQHFQAAVVAQHPGLANPQISKIIGEKWRTLPNESKQDWKNLAEEEKARHQQQYPDYRYQPRRYGRKGSNIAITHSGISNNPTGASVCSRCGGRVMNPPSTPSTPFIPTVPTRESTVVSSHSNQQTSGSTDGLLQRPETRSVSPIQASSNYSWGTGIQPRYRDDNGLLPPDVKRRRCNFFPIRRDLSLGDPYSPRSVFYSRPETPQPRNHYAIEPLQSYKMKNISQTVHDPSLTLPPLQTVSAFQQSQLDQVETMVMTIPFVNKIKLLARISPPFTATKSTQPSRGVVIAVEGQDAESVRCVLQYLNDALSSKKGQVVRIFKGPDLDSSKASTKGEEMRDATVQYLETISSWHKISEDIMRFMLDSDPVSAHQPEDQKPAAELSPTTFAPRVTVMEMPQTDNSVPTSPDSVFRIALVPQYQLSTADAHACATPINDAYAPIDHWQWMASLWRGCVGPDITVYVRDCDEEELTSFGEGNPVEIRLDDARALVVRRLTDSAKPIEEKALRRIGFEVDEFLRR